MVQPAVRIGSAQAASDVARALETPSEVAQFVALAPGSAPVRAFLDTPEWAAIHDRIVGDGRPPTGRHRSLADVARLGRWSADGVFSEEPLAPQTRSAYLHMAAEIDAYDRNTRQDAPVSPAPAAQPAGGGRVAEEMFGLGFGQALLAAQAGRHIARVVWPAGSYVTAQAGYPDGIGVNANTARATGLAEGTTVVFGPYLMLCQSFGDLPPEMVPWTPGQNDLFAQDWRILSRAGER